jgi:endoglucanase
MLFDLCGATGVTGLEREAARLAAEYLAPLCDAVRVDPLGSVLGSKAGEGAHILLEAHLDQIGLVVTGAEDGGFLRAAPCGGVDRRLLCGQEVTVHGTEDFFGVIPASAPHLAEKDSEKALPATALLIDTGLTRAEAERKAPAGSRVRFRTPPVALGEHRVTAPALDDRAGICALLRCMELLQGQRHAPVTVLFAVQEETGGAGAQAAAYGLQPAQALVVDVSFAQAPGVPATLAQGKLGGGVMVGFAPVLDQGMSERLCALAEQSDIAFTREIMGGRSYTDADKIQTTGSGVPCALLSIPLRNMHSAVETLDLRDVEATAQLLAAYIIEKGAAA